MNVSAQNFPSISIGGRLFTDIPNLIVLKAGVNGASVRASARSQFASAGYQVTAGKTLTIFAIQVNNLVADAGSLGIGYTDNDLGLAGTTAVTNQKMYGTGVSSATGSAGDNGLCPIAAVGQNERATVIKIPATKYVCIEASSGSAKATVVMYGYEA